MISSSSTTHLAVRKHGVCRGSLWRQEVEGSGTSAAAPVSPSASSNDKDKNTKKKRSGNNSLAAAAAAPTPVAVAASASSSSSFWSSAEVEYCTVTSNWFICHESFAAHERGDAPLHMYRIVGASSYWTVPNHATTNTSSSSSYSNNNKSFQLVTNQGKQLLCQAVTPKCREHWLATLQAGLELTLLRSNDTLLNSNNNLGENNDTDDLDTDTILQPPAPQWPLPNQPIPSSSRLLGGSSKPPRYCSSCGALETTKPLTATSTAPVVQYGMEHKMELCSDCSVAQGLLHHLELVKSCMASSLQEHEALIQARELCVNLVTPKQQQQQQQQQPQQQQQQRRRTKTSTPSTTTTATTTTESLSPLRSKTTNESSPNKSNKFTSTEREEKQQETDQLPQQQQQLPTPSEDGQDAPQPTEEDFSNPQSPSSSTAAGAADDKDSDSSNESWTKVDSTDEPSLTTSAAAPESATKSSGADPTTSPSKKITTSSSSSWIHISPTSKSTAALLKALRDKKRFGTWLCASPFLEALTEDLLEGRIGVPDFLEQLDDAVGQGETETASLKKQAFRVAGDMGTAMKLLLDYALQSQSQHADSSPATTQHATQMLQCLLEFFLDLCHEGELSSVAFFWPQLCHIHLCMLPPENALAVARVDLMEDFLLTVASQYSIHLALELVWSHTADLEESLNHTLSSSSLSPTSASAASPTICSPACRARRFAVLRFVCELESYLFGHEDGWDGGSVTLGKMLSATADQSMLLKKNIRQIQNYRRRTVLFGKLDRSVRHAPKIPIHHHPITQLQQQEREEGEEEDLSAEELIQEKLRIAKNADYFSSHLNFTKRICDIAEKLRFMDVNARAGALQEELRLLNASGSMGGDPLNRISDSMIRIVRVPSTEGHVFRSKERTPVLLLVEQVDEGAEMVDLQGGKAKWDRVVKETKSETMDESSQGETMKPSESEQPQAVTTGNDNSKIDEAEHETQGPEANLNKGESTLDELPDHSSSSRHRSSSSELEGTPQDHRQHTKALKRFDGLSSSSSLHRRGTSEEAFGSTASMPKDVVDQMVTNVMVEQLKRDINSAAKASKDEGGDGTTDKQDNSSRASSSSKTSKKQTETSPSPASPPQSSSSGTPKMVGPRRMFKNSSCDTSDRFHELAPTGDIRREVLNVIMMRGRRERNSIAAGAADFVQRSLKELEIKRATALLLDSGSEQDGDEGNGDKEKDGDKDYQDLASTKERLASLGLDKNSAGGKSFDLGDLTGKPSEEDEVMEAVRLLLVQNRVAQGHLSPADAAKVLQHVSLSRVSSGSDLEKGGVPHPSQMPSIDAGDLDPRLAGCGPLPPAVLQALTLWKGEMVTNGELLELVKKDIEFVRHSVLLEAENVDKLKEDSAFWGRFAFGERWAEKKARIAASSPLATHPGWDLVGIIVKSNDDLRQEAFVMQLIELCQEAFEIAGLELWVSPYRILATGRTTGIIEMVRNAMSFDALKKRPGYGKGGLREHLHRMTEFSADPGGSFRTAQQNFVRSLAAYSLMSYFFLFKDRHNGNLLLDTAGHVIHIDFGFVFGVAPGGSFSLEMSTPFKLTDEMLEVMGGPQSPLFSDFVTLFCCGFLALQSYSDTFLTLVEITSRNSTFKCFSEGPSREEMLAKMRERFRSDLSQEETVAYALDLIQQAITSYGTRQYDLFQYLSQGIAS